MSIPAFARITPVSPPTVKRKIKPIANNIGVRKWIDPPQAVAIQLKILIPVGTAIIIVAAVKYARVSISSPTVYMWCSVRLGGVLFLYPSLYFSIEAGLSLQLYVFFALWS